MLAGNIYKLPYKYILKLTYQKEYQKHMYRCDNAMRNQFISKARAAKEPSNKSAKDLLASEIALIDCHDYDVFRKKLLTLGLTELDFAASEMKKGKKKERKRKKGKERNNRLRSCACSAPRPPKA